ncbi:hypothetical protein [Streptomyces griseomycini]|uniref:Rubredoxin n=1 Tax=Streptomyces griseomycini TaxID=66895 RepID=A0A7W7VA79_9ACTN|nr:hypothetical protein [Streptomyces griseomycini]MBB4902562.1 rubredoxin [Streptomyces griseomycini]
MTTRTTPPRTTLPPHLTRHFYETRRAFLRQATGEESTPWFALTALERAVVESEMTLFREAIRRAEEEQDLLASLDATTGTAPVATAAEDAPEHTQDVPEATAAEEAPEDCPCPGCSAVAAVVTLLEQMGKKLEVSLGLPATDLNDFPFNISEVTTAGPGRTPTAGETERLRQVAKNALDEWVAAGKPLKVVPGPAAPAVWTLDITPAWLASADPDDGPAQRRYERQALRYFRGDRLRPPFSPGV